MSGESALGGRIKRYEAAYNQQLTPRSCLFLRVDGKAFHTFTRGCEKPFDKTLRDAMVLATRATSREMQGFKLAYHQSDEVTFMLTDFDTYQTQGWFGYELNKVVSITASTFTAKFNRYYGSQNGVDAIFDARAFIVPIDDAPNVFIWRQQDWERNSIQMLTRAHFSQKECHQKRIPDMHEMLHGKGINWAHLPGHWKNGTFVDREQNLISDRLDYPAIAAQLQPWEHREERT